MLIFDRGVGLPGGQVDGAHEKRDLVVGIEAVPETIRKGGGGLIAQLYGPGFSLKGGERVAVGLVSTDKVALAGNRGVILIEKAPAAGGVSIRRFQNGQAIGAVGADHTGDAGGIVGTVGLKLPGAQRADPAPAAAEGIGHRVGLVTVGDDGGAVHHPDGVVDDQGGVGHSGLVKRLGTDAVLGDFKNAVAAVFTAAHDEVGDNCPPAVGGAAQQDTAAGVGVAREIGKQVVHSKTSI